MVLLLLALGQVLKEFDSLEASFMVNQVDFVEDRRLLSQATYQWNQRLRQALVAQNEGVLSYGCGYMFPQGGVQTSPLKRLYLFLKWMVRFDATLSPSVDLGYWAGSIAPKALIIPLDTHVHTISLRYGLTHRKSKNLETALDITDILSLWCPNDPLVFDFAFMGIGTTKSAL